MLVFWGYCMKAFSDVKYLDSRDIELIEKGINYNVWLMCGDNIEQQKELKNIFVGKCTKLNIIGQKDKHSILSSGTLGYCCADENQNYIIEMYGYKDSTIEEQKKLTHESVHEFCHAMQHIMCDNSKFYDYNGCRYYVHGGTIVEEKLKEKKFSSYGVMFCETITDLLTSIAIAYNENNHRLNADQILTHNYRNIAKYGLILDGYSIYTSIARLAIAAFNNGINYSYDSILKSGQSIITAKVTDRLGNIKPLNDMLYGIMFDSRYIEDCYDKYMGNNSYYELCSKLDTMLKRKQSNPFIIKEVMQSLAVFHNKKNQDLFTSGAITQDELIESTSFFNNIFNQMQNEFNAYFFQTDLSSLLDTFKPYQLEKVDDKDGK